MNRDLEPTWRSPNFNSREGAPIDMLVLHYTGMKSCDEALERLCDPAAEVSAHYLIDEDGTVHHLVDESERAWHAGVAMWRGKTNINSRSIGIELVNPGHEWGYRHFPEAQMQALILLCNEIQARYRIPGRNIVGHSDVAPARKLDPGELFNWRRLAENGVGFALFDWDIFEPVAPEAVVSSLAAYGYDVSDEEAAITAFQRHFRQRRVDGTADEETRRRIACLLDNI